MSEFSSQVKLKYQAYIKAATRLLLKRLLLGESVIVMSDMPEVI